MDGLIQVWAVYGDGGERGIGPIIGYASSESTAKDMAVGKGFWGSPGSVREAWAVQVNGKVYAVVSPTPIDIDGKQAVEDERLRQETMKALTADQLRVLGVK